MTHDSNQTIDWDLVYRACRLKDVGLTYELFIKDPWNILHGLDRLDAIDTLAAGELPVPVEPATPAFWDALYKHCEFVKCGIQPQRFKTMPWVYLIRHGHLDAPRQVRGWRTRRGARPAPASGPTPGETASGNPSARTSQPSGTPHYRPGKAPPRPGIIRRITDVLAQVVDGFYPLVLTATGRWQVDRERIAASGDRYSMRLYFLVLIASLAGVLTDQMSHSPVPTLAIFAFSCLAVAGLTRLRGIEASVQN